ncbi:transcription factor TGA1 isoform X1 [Olea europaea subsp. europaea]|uniref:Transcription factor TGA1 isoform X1 n=1 Tax=Olea europaea subsp. europaea TaxID=158383 RepID=A0A8S0RH84_OLEEU|nr:transcription factor TGA1 isoform X1 [Olea europaea subsp. europaea]
MEAKGDNDCLVKLTNNGIKTNPGTHASEYARDHKDEVGDPTRLNQLTIIRMRFMLEVQFSMIRTIGFEYLYLKVSRWHGQSKTLQKREIGFFHIGASLEREPARIEGEVFCFFRSSEMPVLLPHLEPLSDEQQLEVSNLRQSCQQAEDALSQGMDKLHQIIAETICGGRLGEGNYLPQLAPAMEKLEPLVRFVNQADHLRRETLQQISLIINIHQAARGLLALGEYFQRLRVLSSLWASCPREPA